jgi:hypothetical protein
MKDLHPFTLEPDRSQRAALRGYLLASLAYQKVRGLRVLLFYGLVALGSLVWVDAGWPYLLPQSISVAAWASWMAGLLGALAAVAVEVICNRRRMRWLSRLGQPFSPELQAPPGPRHIPDD